MHKCPNCRSWFDEASLADAPIVDRGICDEPGCGGELVPHHHWRRELAGYLLLAVCVTAGVVYGFCKLAVSVGQLLT